MLASLRLSNVQSNVTFGKIRRFYVLPNITCFLSEEYIYLMVIFLEAVVFFSTMANQRIDLEKEKTFTVSKKSPTSRTFHPKIKETTHISPC